MEIDHTPSRPSASGWMPWDNANLDRMQRMLAAVLPEDTAVFVFREPCNLVTGSPDHLKLGLDVGRPLMQAEQANLGTLLAQLKLPFEVDIVDVHWDIHSDLSDIGLAKFKWSQDNGHGYAEVIEATKLAIDF